MPEWLLVLTLLILGIILIMLEIFIIPGFGFLGIIALGCLGAASYFSYAYLSPVTGIGIGVISVIIVVFLIRYLPRSKVWQQMQLKKNISRKNGFSAVKEGLEKLTGDTGRALTNLRPVGKALIGGKQIDVIAELGMIEKGREIQVIKVEGNRVVVKEK